jgi:hypothetical protein
LDVVGLMSGLDVVKLDVVDLFAVLAVNLMVGLDVVGLMSGLRVVVSVVGLDVVVLVVVGMDVVGLVSGLDVVRWLAWMLSAWWLA